MIFNINFLSNIQLEAQYGDLGFLDSQAVIADGIYQVYTYINMFLSIIFIFLLVLGWRILKNSFRVFFYDIYVPKSKKGILVTSVYDRIFWTQGTKEKFKLLKDFSTFRASHNVLLEFVWTLIPGFILMIIAVPSFILLYSMDEIIEPVITLKILGHQWYWEYNYNVSSFSEFFDAKNEKISFESWIVPVDDLKFGDLRLLEVDNTPVLPIETHIRIIISSIDVLHSWALPSAGIKIDAVPGRLNQGTIFFYNTGIQYGQCSELCGLNHGYMPIVIKTY